MKCLFGPVPSRRLGVSLGVDIVPHKICSLNCVYCEVGKTTRLTTKRDEYIPINNAMEELSDYLSKNPPLDFVTFSGQGEPTLNSGLGRAIDFVKNEFPRYKVAVITNGTLFNDKTARDEVGRADVLLPSLDAASGSSFFKINRPDESLEVNKIIEGLASLRKEFKGEIRLEIFLVPAINDGGEELALLKKSARKISPDRIQLNTLDRPGVESWLRPVSLKRMEEISVFFKPLPVEIISKTENGKRVLSFDENTAERLLETIKRRPCSDSDLARSLNIHVNELNKYLVELIKEGAIESERLAGGLFFKLRR